MWLAHEIVEYHLGMSWAWPQLVFEELSSQGLASCGRRSTRRSLQLREGLQHEVRHWFDYLRSASFAYYKGLPPGMPFGAAMDVSRPLDRRIQHLLSTSSMHVVNKLGVPERGQRQRVRILDVGSGPMSPLGYAWPGTEVELVAADPLACEYKELRRMLGIAVPDPLACEYKELRRMLGIAVPDPVAPRFAEAEGLAAIFGESSFDAVHCMNALDHAHDPAKGLAEMLRVVRPGSPVILRHRRNESTHTGGVGSHHWDMDVSRDLRFLLRRKGGPEIPDNEIDLGEFLVSKGLVLPGDVTARPIDHPEISLDYKEDGAYVEAVVWRRPL
eukprot:gnl/TRDRNA2_/TRDRNA2_140036_c0_seq2.p1 gnl/TRDRNA2_/TRDRNA2_140036_c0~~gnl/TRDRNA2_/TRDRNA2_140036_c0_seq2.p1  ORF type:complete len:339 (-),score=28.89 gnl/TRDRNA2_/TRDRNA2_140036_c0_seq2:156-1142(-)